VIAQRDRDFASAAKHYQQAVEMDQAYLAAWQRLSICYAAQRLTREAIEAQSRATNLVHTSAASKLKLAWLDLPRTAYETASKGVEAAAAIDPADPRVPTYYGAVARAQSNWKEAAACFLAAAVLERAHQSLRGTDLQNGQRFTAEQIARLIAYQTAAGEAMLQSKQLEKASSLLTSNFNLHANTPADQRYAFVPWALVPEVPDDPDALPYEPNIEAYVTWSALLAGRVYAQQQRYDQAAQQFEWAAGHESRKPPTMDQGMAIRIPGLWARLGLVDIALQQGRADKASFFMQNYGHPNIATAAMKEEAGRLRNALEAQDQRSGGDTYHDMLDRARRNAQ
jgi:tetratricopeptide (TPR) repeat protein